MAKILDGKKLSIELARELSKKVAALKSRPKLVIVQVGDLAESNTYIKNKKLFAEKIGVEVVHKKYTEKVSQTTVTKDIEKFNKDKSVNGIIVQLPIPSHLNTNAVLEAIDPTKDVDGMTSRNVKLLFEDAESFVPATTKGILLLLEKYKISLAGKKVVMVGYSNLVGKPTATALLNRDATVTICNDHTKNLKKETQAAEILVVATGHPKLITKNHVSKNQIVIDIGINILNKNGKKKIVGDVDFENVAPIVRAITPVPGGVGPMTIVSLFQNLLLAYRNQNNLKLFD